MCIMFRKVRFAQVVVSNDVENGERTIVVVIVLVVLAEIHHYIEQKNDILSKKSMKILKSF